MRSILAKIVEKKYAVMAAAKKRRPLDALKEHLPCGMFRMVEHFRWRGWDLITECKLQSPVEGRLTMAYSVTELADIYTAADGRCGHICKRTDEYKGVMIYG